MVSKITQIAAAIAAIVAVSAGSTDAAALRNRQLMDDSSHKMDYNNVTNKFNLQFPKQQELKPICSHLFNQPEQQHSSSDHSGSSSDSSSSNHHKVGCLRYTKGFDITGVTTEVDLTIQDGIINECSCLAACLSRPTTCVSWVWKFTTDPNHRTCTLYSNFNLPNDVTIAYNLNSPTKNINAELLVQHNNNPQAGAPVPQCTLFNSSIADPHCFSGVSFQTADNGKYIC